MPTRNSTRKSTRVRPKKAMQLSGNLSTHYMKKAPSTIKQPGTWLRQKLELRIAIRFQRSIRMLTPHLEDLPSVRLEPHRKDQRTRRPYATTLGKVLTISRKRHKGLSHSLQAFLNFLPAPSFSQWTWSVFAMAPSFANISMSCLEETFLSTAPSDKR